MNHAPRVTIDKPIEQASTRCQIVHALRFFEPGDIVTREQIEAHLPPDSDLWQLSQLKRTQYLCSRIAQLCGSRRRRRPDTDDHQAPPSRSEDDARDVPDPRGPEPFPNCLKRVSRGHYEVLEGAFDCQTIDERYDRQGPPVAPGQRNPIDPRVTDELVSSVRRGAGIPADSVHDVQLRRIMDRTLTYLKV